MKPWMIVLIVLVIAAIIFFVIYSKKKSDVQQQVQQPVIVQNPKTNFFDFMTGALPSVLGAINIRQQNKLAAQNSSGMGADVPS